MRGRFEQERRWTAPEQKNWVQEVRQSERERASNNNFLRSVTLETPERRGFDKIHLGAHYLLMGIKYFIRSKLIVGMWY